MAAVFISVALSLAQAPAAAQGADIGAIYKRFIALYSAGNYGAALIEAQKYEAAIKLRFGTNHANYATALNNLAVVYQEQGNYGEAEGLYRRALAIREQAFGVNHPDVAATLNNFANLYQLQGKYGEAEGLYRRALAIREQALGVNHPELAATLNNLAGLYRAQGKYVEAEGLFERALAIREKTFGANHADVAQTLHNLGFVYQSQGKYGEAESRLRHALAIREKTLGANHPAVAQTLNNLALLYRSQGKFGEAEGVYQRALAIAEKALGANHPVVAQTLSNLAVVCQDQGKYGEAEGLSRRALAIREETLGANHPAVADTLIVLANLYEEQGKYGEAEGLYRRALAVKERALGANHADVAMTLNNLALLYQSQGKFAEAERLYRRALAIREETLGANHPDVAMTLNNLALLNSASRNAGQALALSREASAAVIAHATTEAPAAQQREGPAGLVEQRASYFRVHVANLAAAARTGIESEPALGREALTIAQWASQSSAAVAVQQMAARFAGGGALGALVRDSQDLSALWRDRDKALIEALSKPEDQRNQVLIDDIRKQIAEVEDKLHAVTARLEKEFPDYAALTSPKPLDAEHVQKLLETDEALVFLLAGDSESFVFALTRNAFEWHTIPLDSKALSAKVAAFRHGLDVDEMTKAANAGKPELFDLGLAHEFYTALLGPVEPLINDKGHLLVVPTGALTSLPFHLLVTEKPAVAVPQLKEIASYRDAPWLIKRQAVSVLPSVASLKALRVFARKDQAAKPLVGFGDPVFDPAERTAALAARAKLIKQAANVRSATTRAYSDVWQGSSLDRTELAKALPSLLDTADELKAVAARLGAPASDIHLAKDASETTIKRTPLADYRVVYFATHGLVAGDVKGLGEPALALTLPAQPSELDDGLLTASEVAQLKLNADWVVLSACNTAAGDKPGAEALSGLARAFFYAGARALLVSHWSVDSEAATRLTTSTFDIMKGDAKAGRAEALRRAMLTYMNDTSDPLSAYPAYWAPFSVIGEGAAR